MLKSLSRYLSKFVTVKKKKPRETKIIVMIYVHDSLNFTKRILHCFLIAKTTP